MEDFLIEMAEILEEDSVRESDELNGFESWDSLAALSVIAMADEKFGVNATAQDLKGAETVGDLYALIQAKNAA
jgi:acyl carrier protein